MEPSIGAQFFLPPDDGQLVNERRLVVPIQNFAVWELTMKHLLGHRLTIVPFGTDVVSTEHLTEWDQKMHLLWMAVKCCGNFSAEKSVQQRSSLTYRSELEKDILKYLKPLV